MVLWLLVLGHHHSTKGLHALHAHSAHATEEPSKRISTEERVHDRVHLAEMGQETWVRDRILTKRVNRGTVNRNCCCNFEKL